MSENTKIEWCDHTFNPWVGCTKVSPACDHCYAEGWAKRSGSVEWGGERRHTTPANWRKPMQWQAKAAEFMAQHGRRQRVFCASLADVFDNQVPVQWRIELMELIARTPDLEWLLLTKRIGNAHAMLDAALDQMSHGLTTWGDMPWPNVWIGATICNQAEADRDIPKLAAIPASVRFLSIEPLLGAVDLRLVTKTWAPGRCNHCCNGDRCDDRSHYDRSRCPHCHGTGGQPIKWVIVGGESGPGARPMHPDWARSVRDQCAAAGVPFLFKQWGEWKPINQMEEAQHAGLYVPNIKAKPHEDQANIDDIYGRHCTVVTTVIHFDGSLHDIAEPMAFLQGTGAMQTFRVGKKAAGRLLDGIEHNGFPEAP